MPRKGRINGDSASLSLFHSTLPHPHFIAPSAIWLSVGTFSEKCSESSSSGKVKLLIQHLPVFFKNSSTFCSVEEIWGVGVAMCEIPKHWAPAWAETHVAQFEVLTCCVNLASFISLRPVTWYVEWGRCIYHLILEEEKKKTTLKNQEFKVISFSYVYRDH